ncbi:protein RIC-3b isoform X2 [Nothobranchius furzeri]|uniref:Protein RIC-3-like n=1 Tax=Nothobranchius furzeri TaxID=105023 RepID=A0A8C6NYB7_NOTFU|nr:protein RIC-3b isoform X1 [Nothobranchius furzeri]KAF7199387.1 transcript variant X2 [Nothobranchius furzeri]
MAMSMFQKVTLATCLLLCVALLLPKMLLSRGRKDAAPEAGSGQFPPMMHRQVAPESRGQRTAGSGGPVTRAKGAGTGAGTGGKSNLAGQIIPVYGFGILLYILYILFKITSKGSSKPSEGRFPPVRSENMKRKITDFELAQLQEKLRETELVMEKIVSTAHHSPDRVKGVMPDQEESLLQQLTEITRVMQEGQLVEGIVHEKKTPEEDWEDYPEEPSPYWEHGPCCCQHGAAEAQLERTEVENLPDQVTGSGGLGADIMQEPASAADVIPQRHVEVEQKQDANEIKEEGGHRDPEFQEEQQAQVLQELELILKTTSVLEQGTPEDIIRPAGTQMSCGSVRRRHKKRTKKATHCD